MMKKDYLTNNGQADNEIRELEELLSVFRHDPEAVIRLPEFPAAEKPTWNWNFSFSLTTAAASLLIVAVLSIFIQSDRNDTAHTYPAGRQGTAALDSHTAEHEASSPVSPPIRAVEPLHASVEERRPRRKLRQRALPFKKSRVKTPGPAHLTDEERYAYQQLKLALAITSSKLKIVKDSINGVNEDPNATPDVAR